MDKKTIAGTKYLALLRGINVGGNNIIKMVDLKKCFESMGFTDVVTYIQSGNVIFSSEEKSQAKLITTIEECLSKKFNYKSKIVLVTDKQLEKVVKKAPKGFGTEPDTYRYDVIFIKEPLKPAAALKEIRLREGVDTAFAGEVVLYFARTIDQITKSYISKIVGTPNYKNMTIRNWNTTSKLLVLMQKQA